MILLRSCIFRSSAIVILYHPVDHFLVSFFLSAKWIQIRLDATSCPQESYEWSAGVYKYLYRSTLREWSFILEDKNIKCFRKSHLEAFVLRTVAVNHWCPEYVVRLRYFFGFTYWIRCIYLRDSGSQHGKSSSRPTNILSLSLVRLNAERR